MEVVVVTTSPTVTCHGRRSTSPRACDDNMFPCRNHSPRTPKSNAWPCFVSQTQGKEALFVTQGTTMARSSAVVLVVVAATLAWVACCAQASHGREGATTVPTIFIVPHSHDDTGWLRTVDEYHNEWVRYILDGVVHELSLNRNRTFVQVRSACVGAVVAHLRLTDHCTRTHCALLRSG